jgi:uncharacterized protein involved in exopolysaccharide biosynthesis
MTESYPGRYPAKEDPGELSLLGLGSVVLRRRRLILALALTGALVGLASGLLSKRVYKASATFIPQGSEGGLSGLALAASQFGIRAPSAGGGWGAPIYVELLKSRALLDPIIRDSIVIDERQGAKTAVIDLLGVKGSSEALRTERAVRRLRAVVSAQEDRKQGAVNLTVTTQWPSVSFAIAQRLVRGVNLFNVDTRKSQAREERLFVEAQTTEAERNLRAAEDRLQSFLQQNRVIGTSSQLEFQRDRLQRDVTLRQQVYSNLAQSHAEARIREVRDIPVITVLEEPRLPVTPEPTRSLFKMVVGAAFGLMFGVFIALVANGLSVMSRDPSAGADEFFRLARESVPSFLRRKRRERAAASS